MRTSAFALALFAVACGDEGGSKKPVDAPMTSDAPPGDAGVDAAIDAPPDAAAAIVRVDCATATIKETVTTTNNPQAFTPNNVTILANEVIRFQPGGTHNVVPHPTLPSDPNFRSGALGEVACLQFRTTGPFNWRCGPHASMTGVVNVQ